jgi:lysophospholipase L1-like esterase
MRWLIRRIPHALLLIELLLAGSILQDLANVTTERLYLDRKVAAAPSSAVQRFDIEGSRVVPQIATRDTDERIAFQRESAWPSRLYANVRSGGPATYEIHWREAGSDRVLARGESASIAAISTPIPARAGVLELVSQGPLTWVDPRLVTDLRITGRAVFAVLIGASAIGLARRSSEARSGRVPSRVAAFRAIAGAGGIVVSLAALEAGMRALGDRAPAPLLAERHDLGEVRKDPRWQHTRRYGRRLRPLVDETNEWRYGDIVRMGFIPADVSEGIVHRYPFHTDAEGFRNARTRDRIDIAALGDSFTDAMTLDGAAAWPSLLERDSRLAVQNYGTAAFGPQQELRVLTDFALAHQPRVVVLAFFAGNDIFEAEAFEEFEQSNGTVWRTDPGWPIKPVVSRADTWFVVSALHAARRWASSRERVEAKEVEPAHKLPAATFPSTSGFDRGMFTATVNGQVLRWAFMPPYLNTLRMSERDLSTRRGWTLTAQAIADMRDASRAAGAELVVMFLPFKSQVYLPLVQQALPPNDVAQALRFYLPDGAIDVAAMSRNLLAQNHLMRRFCERAGIRFLDTTDALGARVRAGSNVYFPDESHLNETGHAVVADTLRSFLKTVVRDQGRFGG